jgi:outer membrane protein, heavy metal efflux system
MTKWMLLIPSLIFCSCAHAEDPMDLGTAINMAIRNSPSMVALQRERAAAEAEVQIERQFNNPSLIAETTRSQPNYFLGGGYLFELGGKRSKRIEIAMGGVNIADLKYRQALQILRREVRVAFFTLLIARGKENEVSKSRDLAKQLYDVANQRFEVGDVARLEVLQAELELKRRGSELQQTESETRAALVELNVLLHRNPTETLEITDSGAQPITVSLETLTSEAVAGHLSLLSIRQQRKTEEARLNFARAGRIPDLDLEGGAEIHDADFQYGYRAAVRLDLPLFNRKQGEILLASANIERLHAEEDAAILKLRSDISAAYLRYQTALSRSQNYENEILPTSRQIEQLAVESYQAGKSGILAVIDAQRSAREVQIESLDVLLQLQTALADLEQTAGTELK